MKQVLEGALHFDVVYDTDVTEARMRSLVDRFKQKLQPDCVGLVYYSGHGLEDTGGVNYMLPVDVKERDLAPNHSVRLQDLKAWMKEKQAVARLAFFDSCRSLTLYGERGTGPGGMKGEGLGRGSFTGYSTAPGQVADDSSGFTASLAKWMAVPGLTVEEVFNHVQNEVGDDDQIPVPVDMLLGDFYFLPPLPGEQPPPPPPPGHTPGERKVTSTGVALRWVPPTGPGGFEMGSPPGEDGRDDDEGPVQVVLTEGRWVMETEVTQGMYQQLMDVNP